MPPLRRRRRRRRRWRRRRRRLRLRLRPGRRDSRRDNHTAPARLFMKAIITPVIPTHIAALPMLCAGSDASWPAGSRAGRAGPEPRRDPLLFGQLLRNTAAPHSSPQPDGLTLTRVTRVATQTQARMCAHIGAPLALRRMLAYTSERTHVNTCRHTYTHAGAHISTPLH